MNKNCKMCNMEFSPDKKIAKHLRPYQLFCDGMCFRAWLDDPVTVELYDTTTCGIEGCWNDEAKEGLCIKHYRSLKYYTKTKGVSYGEWLSTYTQSYKVKLKKMYSIRKKLRKKNPPCIIESCEKLQRAKGLCNIHYASRHYHISKKEKPISHEAWLSTQVLKNITKE